MSAAASERPTIAILGAGVVGLSAALLLQSRGYQVHIVAKATPDAKHWDQDALYTSREAGAHWLSAASNDDTRLQEYEWASYQMLMNMAQWPESGVSRMRNVCVYKEQPSNWQMPWYADRVQDFRLLAAHELAAGSSFGFQFTTASKNLGGVMDQNVFPIRGQTILIRPAIRMAETITRLGDSTNAAYIIPRDDGTVLLGGTYEPYNHHLAIDPQTARGIVDRCRQICPDVVRGIQVDGGSGGAQVVRHGVGLRPFRRGGIRVECDVEQRLVHLYGHGSYGYQASWGSAQAAVVLMESTFVWLKPSYQQQPSSKL